MEKIAKTVQGSFYEAQYTRAVESESEFGGDLQSQGFDVVGAPPAFADTSEIEADIAALEADIADINDDIADINDDIAVINDQIAGLIAASGSGIQFYHFEDDSPTRTIAINGSAFVEIDGSNVTVSGAYSVTETGDMAGFLPTAMQFFDQFGVQKFVLNLFSANAPASGYSVDSFSASTVNGNAPNITRVVIGWRSGFGNGEIFGQGTIEEAQFGYAPPPAATIVE